MTSKFVVLQFVENVFGDTVSEYQKVHLAEFIYENTGMWRFE